MSQLPPPPAPYSPPPPAPGVFETPSPVATPSAAAPQGVSRRPANPAEREVLLRFLKQQRATAVAMSVVAFIFSMGYYAYYSGFLLFLMALVFVFVALGRAGNLFRARKTVAAGQVVDIQGPVQKLGDRVPGARRGQTYALQIGADRVTVPLAVYDRFAPGMPGCLTLAEAAHQAVAANGAPLARPSTVRWVVASPH